MNTKEIEKFATDTEKRIGALQKLIDRQHESIATMAAMQGDLAAGHARQNEKISALETELARVANSRHVVGVASKPPVVDKRAIVGRIEQHNSSPVTVLANLSPHVEIPSESQFKNLVAIIAGRYPKFAAVDLAEVRRAFIAVGHCNRMPAGKLNMQSGVTGWTDILEDWQRTHSLTGGISGGAVTVAVLMHNDIEYSALDRWPLDVEFGLHRPYSTEGRKCSNSWKALLHGTELLRGPTPVKRIVDNSIGFQHQIPSW